MNKQEIIERLKRVIFLLEDNDEYDFHVATLNSAIQSLTTEPQVDKVTAEEVLNRVFNKSTIRPRYKEDDENVVFYHEDIVLKAMQTYATQSNAELLERIKLLELIIKENSSNSEQAHAEGMREHAIGFLNGIRAYEHESGKAITYDERESSELYDIYLTTLTK